MKVKGKILIFGGTTEGRLLAGLLKQNGIPHQISVATDYGAMIEYEDRETEVLVGRRNEKEISALLREEEYTFVVDATHPFAVKAHEDIKKACENAGTEYLRLKRPASDPAAEAVYVDSPEEAGIRLNRMKGRLFFMTGAKELSRILPGIEDKTRVFVRVLPEEGSIRKCREAGLLGSQIIAMQGPFSEEMNLAFFRELGISGILTKESGAAGGFDSKLAAAARCHVKAVVLRNPEAGEWDKGLTFPEVIKRIEELFCLRIRKGERRILLAGIGPGAERFFTGELKEALLKADALFGAEAVLKRVPGRAERIPVYEGERIHAYLEEHPGIKNPVAVFSGDISLCSGAHKAAAFFREKGYEIRTLSGISSVALFAGRLSLSLENTCVVSTHGRERNVCGFVRQNQHVILLPSGPEQGEELCTELFKDFPGLLSGGRIVAGLELGTDRERVFEVTLETGLKEEKGRILLYVYHPEAKDRPLIPAIPDAKLQRGAVPMTKDEIRGLSLRKLGLTKNAVLFDIGAGTGSVSIEAALLYPDIKVYSVEKKEEALSLLRANKERFAASNMEIIEGEAPEALEGLRTPTHGLIGGSGGRLLEILGALFLAGKGIRILLHIITPETLGELMRGLKETGFTAKEILAVQVTRYEAAGSYHLPKANNPVFLVTLEGGDRS